MVSCAKLGVLVLALAFGANHNCIDACGGCGPSPRHGGWSSWQPASWEETQCSSGYKTRNRNCDNPSPAHGGRYCKGVSSKSIDCNECDYNNGGCEHKCINYYGSPNYYKCRCYAGSKTSPGNSHGCDKITCNTNDWPSPSNGHISWHCSGLSQVDSGTTCVVTCDNGFEIDGPSSSICGSDGDWDPRTTANCRVRECQPLTAPDNGQITPAICKTKPLHGQICYYECSPGYTRTGPSSNKCDNGYWKQGGFHCQDKEAPSFGETCPSAQSVYADEGKTEATVSWGPVTATDNDQAILTWSPHVTSPHMFREGSHTVVYTATDPAGNTNFCHFQVTVQVLRCSILFSPADGRLENAACGNVYGSICRLACNRGFELKGSVERKCDKEAGTNVVKWTGNATYCEAIHCPSLDTPGHAIKSGYGCSGLSSSYSTSCFLSCMLGYEAVGGSQKRTCLETGQWSGTQLQCQAITCPPLTITSEGLDISPPLCTNTSAVIDYASECRFTCKSGYQQHGPGLKTCTQFKNWAPLENPSCRDVTAPVFSNCSSNIVTTADRGTTSTQVTWSHPSVTDNSGVIPNITHSGKQPGELFPAGEHNIRYLASDKTGNVAECKFKVFVIVVRCQPKLYSPAGGATKCTRDNQYGSECSFACHIGHTMTGSARRLCEKNQASSVGFWTGNETKCELVRCARLVPPPHSVQSGCGGGSGYNVFGDKCLLYCNRGYRRVNGSTERICQANGTWSGEKPYCQVVRCKSLQAPKDGHVTPNSCGVSPEYDTTCHFSCRKGYRLHGEPIATCLSDGQWSRNTTMFCKDVETPSFGLTCPSDIRRYADKAKNYTTVSWSPVVVTDNSGPVPSVTSTGVKSIYHKGKHVVMYNASDEAGNFKICKFHVTVEVLRCQTLLPPLNGFLVGDCDNIYGSTCRMTCNDGYNLLGSENLTCLNRPGHITGYWDKPVPVCKVRSCSSLSAPQYGFIYPHMCTSFPISGTACYFECRHGFLGNGGVNLMHCENDGTWSKNKSSILKCLDVTSPVLMRCPSDIRANIGINSTALVNWTEPIALDNSNLAPQVTVVPPGISPPHIFNETTIVVYTARDASGNKRDCSFRVILEDNSGPVVVYCPPDQNVIATQMSTLVTWNDPQFKDNSNNPLEIRCSHQSGTQFYWGTWNVHCTAFDNNPNNNPAVCQFTLTIKPKACPKLTPPKHGAMACDDWMFGRFCSPFCHNNTDFAKTLPTSVWACGAKGTWFPPTLWTDCTKIYKPNEVRMAMDLHYYYGDCTSPEAQAQIQENFIKLLNESQFQDACRDSSLKDKCIAENVKVTCSLVDSVSSRKKRAIDEDDYHSRTRRSLVLRTSINLVIVVNLDGFEANDTKESQIMIGEEGIKIAKDISSHITSAVDNGNLSLTINGTVFIADKQSLNISEPKRFCTRGQTLKGEYCLNCTAGTYLNKTLGTCEDCPIGTYQELDAQEKCMTCPQGTWTTESRTDNSSSCLAFCKTGFYSPTGLEPCIACDKGYYQDKKGQRMCVECGVNQTTSAEGSNSSIQCGVPCTAGSFSPIGLAPCTLCDRRSFQPRHESRVCFSCPGTTITVKPGSKNSQDCVEINECESNPCKNNSTCTDLIGDFLCSCQSGYSGKQCDTNIDDCQDQPCFNNGTCHDLLNNYTCSCAYGYRGFNCEEDIDECVSSPCSNNASCKNLPGGYKCQCQPGYTGQLCDTNIDECLLSPCQNGATCRDKINNYECVCETGYQGNDCEENIDDCASDPCQNGAKCHDGINSYYCICPAGFNGTNCGHNIDDCVNTDCKNNAICLDQVNGFYCICKKGFSGKFCEVDIDECVSNPCKNQAVCVDMVNGYRCDCWDGFDGLHCENNIDDCATSPCSNNGSCHDGVNNFTCVCPPGFTDKLCNVDIDYCASMPCVNNGSCLDGITAFTCQCADGFDGDQCQINVDDCKNSTCLNNSTCLDGINEYECACAEGFIGISCEINIDECGQNPCVNDGTCIDLINDYRCICNKGYTGKNCSINIDECASSPCHNNGTCIDKVDNYTCACVDGFSGPHCGVDIDDCLVNSCANGSTCRDGVNSFSCDCAPGFLGDDCQVEIDECASFPCYYGGTCHDQINGFVCVCPTGFTGLQCEENINDCKSDPCVNNGTCSDLVANYTCSCQEGFNGVHCENRIDYCKEANCTQNGFCVNYPKDFYCKCSSGYFGKYCEFEIDECLARPCFNNATCHDVVNNFTCSCTDGYTGRLCEMNIDDCVNNSCLNNATCVDRTLGYSCLCSDGYNGTYCQTEIDECASNPCANNGTCVNLTPGYKCKCLDQFNGENCENLTDLCLSTPCQNGGTCNQTDNSIENFHCSCKTGFTGVACEKNVDDCASSPCMPNSYCLDLVNGYRCECYPSHTGDHCDIFLGSNFDLKFKRKSTDDMVLLTGGNGIPSMRYFTVAQFVRADSSYKSGTLFSYSVVGQPEETIILSFTESQVHLAIKDEIVSADFKLADDQWHYVGVVWNGATGVASVYIDGPEIKKATGVQTGNIIIGGGWVVLGQRYLAEEKTSALSTAFVGTLHQSSLWDVPATADHMWNAAHNCTWPIAGSVRAWSSFLPGIKGQVEKRFMTQCKALEMCTTNCSHFFHCESRQGLYHCTCQAGFSGPHCNINIDDCSSNPCVHGKCVDGINRFDCVCDKGYWGTNCEKEIINEEECPELKKPRNGKTSCRKVSGRMLCKMSCNEGHSFNAGATTVYGCGPDTKWKWNDKEDLTIPACSSKAAPKEIEHRYSVTFVGIQCKTIQSHQALRSAIEKEIHVTLSTVPGCHACQLKEVTVPQCLSTANQKKRRAAPATSAMRVLFSLVVKKAVNSSSSEDNVEEKSEAVLFQMQYAVATGQFAINLHGVNSTADRSSLQHLSSNVTCGIGFVTSGDGKGCVACPVGTFYDENNFKCKPCDKSRYQDEEGQTSCKTCDEGKSTNSSGAASSDDCIEDDSSTKAPVEPEEAKTALYIIVVVVVIAVVILIGIVGYCRFRHLCCFAEKPTLQSGSCRYRPADNNVAQSNPGFSAEDDLELEERRSSQEEADKEPVYSEIPTKICPATYENSDVGFSNSHYQQLDNANGRLTPLYAGLNNH